MSQASEGLRSAGERVRRIRRSHRGSLGVAEIVGLAIAGLMVLAVIVGYLYIQAPAQSRSAVLMRERDHLRQQLLVTQQQFKHDTDVKGRVDEITVSLEKFEDHRLVDRDGGRMALYEDLNQLIRKNSLRNTSGPSYTSLEPLGLKPTGAVATTAANKWQSIYPGIAVNVTVEGAYKDLRHFVRDLETSKDFIVINGVELERAAGSNSQPALSETEVGKPKTASGNALVSLRLDLATYFSRPAQTNDKPAVSAPPVQ